MAAAEDTQEVVVGEDILAAEGTPAGAVFRISAAAVACRTSTRHVLRAPHFAAPHFSAARAHFSASHFSRPSFHAHVTASHFNRAHFGRGNIGHANVSHGNVGHANEGNARLAPSNVHPLATNAHLTPAAHAAAFHADPHSFAEHRHLAGDPAWRPFWNHGWHPHRHLGWIGPLFWPYAYGDFFYYALWPDDYYDADPFWAYGYGDVYSAIFSPYDYTDYVQGPSAPAKMAALTQSMAQSCSDEAAEITGWPIDQIQAAVQPDQQQSALLDDLGNALVKASDEVKMHCPTSVAFTPTARLGAMQQRLQTLVDAVNAVSPPLGKFYDSLSDEQKARFNGIAPPAPKQAQNQQHAQSPQADCNASVMAWPSDQIDHVVRPSDDQRGKLRGAAIGGGASLRYDQGGVPKRSSGNAAGATCRRRPAPQGHAASRTNRAARAVGFL